MDTKELDKMAEVHESLKSQFNTIKAEVQEFEQSQVQQSLSDEQAQYLKDNVKPKYHWYKNWHKHDKSSRTLKRDLLRLRTQLNLLDQKVLNNSNLQTDLDLLIKDVSSLVDKLSAFKKLYDDKVFKIFIIERQHFPLLRKCLYASVQQTRNISLQSWNLFYKVIGFVQSSKLKLLLAAQPVSDITIIECCNQVRYAYLTIAEIGEILVEEDRWVKFMGRVENQFNHDICSSVVAAELVSAVRHIYGHDSVKVRYACQDVVDFVDPLKRCQEKKKQDETHYCYPHDLRECFEYVRDKGIEREEDRPLKIECKREVLPRQGLDLGYIGDVVSLDTVSGVLDSLKNHPVAGCIPVFVPDYNDIGDQLYCGPTSPLSDYHSMHAINFIGAGKDKNGENKYLNARSSHGEDFGNDGNLKVSCEQLMICLSRGHHERYIEDPFLLTGQYVYPKLLSKEEEDKRREKDQLSYMSAQHHRT